MLADNQPPSSHGRLMPSVRLNGTSRYSLLEFIATEIPCWRDDPERPKEESETTLTEHLCDYLNTAARRSNGWDFVQFRTEVVDRENRNRHVDLAPKPCGAIVHIEGKRHNYYDSLFPIECKRLPTPGSARKPREREYVVSDKGSTGGIQRFKSGAHGKNHNFAAMIAYVQDHTPLRDWGKRISGWVGELAGSGGWSKDDCLVFEKEDLSRGVARLRSNHQRSGGLPSIELQHIWVVMIDAGEACTPDVESGPLPSTALSPKLQPEETPQSPTPTSSLPGGGSSEGK
jgi:hypothetical protein